VSRLGSALPFPAVMSGTPLAIGIDFGGTSVKIGVVHGRHVVDQAPPIATPEFDGPEPILEAVARTIENLRAKHHGIAGIGIGVPGFVDFEQGIVHNLTNVPGWTGIPLKGLLAERTGLPVVVDNDANAMTFAEWKLGAGRGMKHLIAITLGTGVGGGVVANNAMIRGARFGAGEVGQMSIDWQGVPGHYGNRGALEEYVGNQQIAEAAHETYREAGNPRPIGECSPLHLSQAAAEEDPIALEVWDLVARKLATALMNGCWLLNPEAIIIGGGVARAGELIFGPLTARLYSQLSPPFKEHLMVLPAHFGNEAGMIGAGALSLEEAGYSVDAAALI